jgi:predicted translin family RNA/ssDNA-binding protein
MAKSLDVSPAKSFAEEVEILRKSFRACLDVYASRVESELSHIKEAAVAKSQAAQLSQNIIRDLRDMITLCRTLDIKPEKGRRKDLKKIDSLIEELTLMVDNW